MKKSLFILATAAIALASCNNDVKIAENKTLGNEPQEIGLFPLNQMPRRAAGTAEYNAVEGTDYPQNYDMKVVAYSVPKTAADGVAGNYFGGTSGQEFTYQPRSYTNALWAGTTAQYWPLAQASLNFLAVSYEGSPDDNKVTPTFASDWASSVSVALADNRPATASVGLGQHDLMYAYGRGTVTKSGNALIIPEKVDMTFNHALAWVYFRVKGDAAAASAIVVESITLKDAYYAGVFTAAVTNYNSYDGALSWTAANTKWTNAATQSDMVSPNQTKNADGDGDASNESQTLTTDFAAVGDGLLVVPTSELTSTVSFSSFVIKYWMNGRTYNYEYTPTDADKTLVKGKKYTYDITMKLSEIFVDASVTNWDESTTFVDVPTTTIAYNESTPGAFTAAAAGTYTFTITNVPANGGDSYTIAAAGSGDDIIDGTPVISHDGTTTSEAGTITVTVKLKSTTGTKNLELKLGGTKKMEVAVTRS